MNFLKFPQAQQFFSTNIGKVPYYQEGKTAIMKIRLAPGDLKELYKSNGEFFIAVPSNGPLIAPPLPVLLIGVNPFAPPNISANGKEEG
jgi:hypothetical protein